MLIVLTVFTLKLQSQPTGTFTDSRDGKTYKTVAIGDQIWMAENLDYCLDNVGYCYNNDTLNCRNYGRLYSWEEAKVVCPETWHLPDTTEWNIMFAFLGGSKVSFDKIAVDNVFIKGMASRENPNDIYQKSSNSSGFSALPSGVKINNSYQGMGGLAVWWTSSEASSNYAFYTYIENNKVRIIGTSKNSSSNKLNEYYSIRCMKTDD